MRQHYIDINCDLGEGQTRADCEQDALLMPYLSRCNIACGAHAGNEETMLQTLINAKQHGILCGAHPGYADPNNFGRVSLALKTDDIIESVLAQIQHLEQIAAQVGQNLVHIKLHGALYNDAEKSPELAVTLCGCLAKQFPYLSIIGLAGGAMQVAAKKQGLPFLREGFIDRAYLANGQLAPRTLSGSVYKNTEQCIAQVLAIVQQQAMTTLDGSTLLVEVDTLCLHGDSPIAYDLSTALPTEMARVGYFIA